MQGYRRSKYKTPNDEPGSRNRSIGISLREFIGIISESTAAGHSHALGPINSPNKATYTSNLFSEMVS